jgi:hypothetical protein
VRIGSDYVCRVVVACGGTLAKAGGAWWLDIMGGVRLKTPAHGSSLTCAGSTCHLPQTPLLRHAEAELGGRRRDSITARHQPLYRDQTVSKRKNS